MGTCFIALTVSNAILSYGHPSLIYKMWIVLFGFLLPGALVFSLEEKVATHKQEPFPRIPSWMWMTLLLLGAILRFYHLFTLSPWPFSDEGLFGYFATLLEEKWDWQILHSVAQEPMLYSWGLYLFFKLFGHSLTTFWFFPALCSFTCVPALWLASRKVLSRGTTFLLLSLMVFSFWPLYLGWFSMQQILLVLWECLALFALGGYLDESKNSRKNPWIYALAILTGTGFYTYLAWPFVALLIGLTVIGNRNQSLGGRLKDALKFLAGVSLVILPLVIAYIREYHGYINHLWAFGAPHPFLDRFSLPLVCLKDFFWGAPVNFFHYGPLWGGFLNPLLTSLFFFGLIRLFRRYWEPLSLWILTAFFVLFLPTVLTNDFEIMRLTPMIPLLLLICALGAQTLLDPVPLKGRLLVFLVVLTASTCLDLFHLVYVYPRDFERNPSYFDKARSPEFNKAYSLLKPLANQQGPGLILLNFNPDPYDQTIFVASYSFNAAENPKLDPTRAKWTGVLANIHEEPYFKKVFPEGKWFWLSEGLNKRDGGLILEIVPVSQFNKPLLSRWAKADLSLKELTRLVMEFNVDPDQSRMLAVLDKAYPSFKGDPLLEARYWRIRAIHHAAEGKMDEAIEDEKQGIEKGLPMAHLYNDLGCLLYQENKLPAARKAFEEALRLRLNLTDAAENLRNLPPSRK